MPEFRALLIERGDEVRVTVAERCHGDTAAEVEKTLAGRRGQPDSVTRSKARLIRA